MPRWFFLVCAVAIALSVVGSVLIVLRSPTDAQRAAQRAAEAARAPAAPAPTPSGR